MPLYNKFAKEFSTKWTKVRDRGGESGNECEVNHCHIIRISLCSDSLIIESNNKSDRLANENCTAQLYSLRFIHLNFVQQQSLNFGDMNERSLKLPLNMMLTALYAFEFRGKFNCNWKLYSQNRSTLSASVSIPF